MAGLSSDLEVLKDIPGYKAILKSVLKSQIQLLIEQLSDHTGEETLILTASVHDGTLSHLGSNTGKGFLDGRDEIKSQFLAFCLKSHHKRKSTEARSSPYQRPQSGGHGDRLTPSQSHSHKRARLQPVSLQRAVPVENTCNAFTPPDINRAPSQNYNANGQDDSPGINVKLESNEQSVSSADGTNYVTSSVSFPTSLQLSHTQTTAEQTTSDNSETQNDDEFTEQTSENDDSTAASIKIEPITENEMELEITGVEPGKSSVSTDSWGQGQMPGTSTVGEGVPTEAGDQSSYNIYLDPEFFSASSDKTSDELRQKYNVFSQAVDKSVSQLETNELLYQSDVSVEHQPSFATKNLSITPIKLSNNTDLMKTEFPKSRGRGKSYNCLYCEKVWDNNYKLQRHMLTHTGEKPYQCDICGRRFTQKSHMENHKVTHSVRLSEFSEQVN